MRKIVIRQHDIRLQAGSAEQIERLIPVPRKADMMPLSRQVKLQQLTDIVIILNDEQGSHLRNGFGAT